MIVISAKDLTKEYGTDTILDKISFHINKGDRVGIIGVNGAGKTTLMRILAGELSKDGGEVFISSETSLGYLKQAGDFNSEKTVMEEVEETFAPLKNLEEELLQISHGIAESPEGSREQNRLIQRHAQMAERFEKEGGYTYKSEIRGILSGMAFGEELYEKPVSTLSGGERTRLSLAILLMRKPDLLLLDEPTNHLDIGTLKWLEQYLKGYDGTILMVSHDRYFLDRTVTHIFEIENHRLYTYRGNYSNFAEKKKRRREEEMRRYTQFKAEKDRQEEMIRRFKGHGTEKLAKRAASREKKLAKATQQAEENQITSPSVYHRGMNLRFKEKFQSGSDVLLAEGLSKSFKVERGHREREIFRNVNLDIKRGERICMVGANGTGKTTLMKILMGERKPGGGYIKKGHNVKFGYYDQGQRLLRDDYTVMEEVRGDSAEYSDRELRTLLGGFLFKGDMVFLKVGELSGGEKARLSLLKLMMSGANVLMLDEPTNHLDIESKEVFEDALLTFPGTSFIISHDRYLLKKIPTRIVELTGDGLVGYPGNYDYYMEKKEEIQSGREYLRNLSETEEEKEKSDEKPLPGSAEDRRLRKKEEARQRRAERKQKKLETEIEKLEENIAGIKEEMCREDVQRDHKRLDELHKELESDQEKLTSIYEKWLQSEDA